MDKIKKQALEAAGWKFGDAEDFLNEGRAMSVDEAMAYASKDKCFWTGEVHTALETLAAEIKRLRAEVEMGHSFHRVAVKERDFERLLVEALKEELAAAKAEREEIQRENEWRNG